MSHKYPLLGTFLIALVLTSLLAQAPALGSSAAAAPGSARGAAPATPALIDRAYAAGAISADQRLLYLAYALYDPAALPEQFRSRAGWYGTRYVR
ncbi:MAG TPA: hypothetical protein VD886_03360, partial [Herpetosiphonaceae bacterium]|nr:hypothetical protein [Herpetosiphonaceae bacterium]